MSGPSGSEGSSAAAVGLKRGPWTASEDVILVEYVRKHGEGNWNSVQRTTGLSRCGKSCRLRWANHLRPNLKKGSFSPEEERLILELHAKLGNKWARMATQLPGRTDNEIKNFWNTRIKRRQRSGLPLYPPDINAGYYRLPAHQSNYNAQFNTIPFQFTGNSSGLPALNGTLLNDIGHRAKRMREDNRSFAMSFSPNSLQIAPNVTPISLLDPTIRYNLGNYDVGTQNFPIMQQLKQQQQQQKNLHESGAPFKPIVPDDGTR